MGGEDEDDDILDPAEKVKSIPPEHAERLRRRRPGYDRVYKLIQDYVDLSAVKRAKLSESELSDAYVSRLFQATGWSIWESPRSIVGGSVPFDLQLEWEDLQIPVEVKRIQDKLALGSTALRQWRGGCTWVILTNFEVIQVWDLDQEKLILETSPWAYVADESEVHELLAASIFYERLAQPRFAQSSDTAGPALDSGVPDKTAESAAQSDDLGELEPFIASLSDPDESIRQRAAEALGRTGNAQAVGPLLSTLSDPDASVRQAAVEALGRIRDPRAVEPLIAVLSDPNDSVRQRAITALGRIGDPLAARPLIGFLSDPNDSIRLAAVEALGQMNISQAAEPLARALEDETASARQAAAEVLEKIGASPGEPAPDTVQRIAVAIRALSDAPSEVDLLGFSIYAEALADFIGSERTEKPLTIAIDAPWGTGKTTLMRMIRDHLAWKRGDTKQEQDATGGTGSRPLMRRIRDLLARKPEDAKQERAFLTVWFNAWKYDEEETLWAALVLALLDQIRQQLTWAERRQLWVHLNWRRVDFGQVSKRLFQSIFRAIVYSLGVILFVAILSLALKSLLGQEVQTFITKIWDDNPGALLGGAGLVTLFVSLFRDFFRGLKRPFDLRIDEYLQEPNYRQRIGFLSEFDEDFKKIVDAVTESGKWPLVVFIDDLDRCAPPKPAQIIEAINLLLDARHCVFVIGMDSKMVSCSIEARYKDLQEHLERTATPGDLTLGQHFLEKIAQITFRIPRADEQHIESFIDALLVQEPEEPQQRLAKEEVVRAEQLIKAEQRAGLTLDEATDVVRAESQDLPGEAVTEARHQVFAKSFDDSEEVRSAIHAVAAYLSLNPRKIKRFMNVFRLQAFIANRQGLLEGGMVQLGSLATWTTIALRWPAMIDALNTDRDFVRALRAAHATKEELKALEQKYGATSAEKRGNLQIQLDAFLTDPRIEQLSQASDLVRLLENMTDADIETFPYYFNLAQTTIGAA